MSWVSSKVAFFYLQIADILFFKNPPPVKKSPIYAFVIFHNEKSVGLALKNKPICLPNGQSLIVLAKVGSS